MKSQQPLPFPLRFVLHEAHLTKFFFAQYGNFEFVIKNTCCVDSARARERTSMYEWISCAFVLCGSTRMNTQIACSIVCLLTIFGRNDVDPTLMMVPWHFNMLVYFATFFCFILDDLQALLTGFADHAIFDRLQSIFFRVPFVDENRQRIDIRHFSFLQFLFRFVCFFCVCRSVSSSWRRGGTGPRALRGTAYNCLNWMCLWKKLSTVFHPRAISERVLCWETGEHLEFM